MKRFKKLYDEAEPIKDESKLHYERILNSEGKDTGCLDVKTENDPFASIKGLLEVKEKNERTDVMPLCNIYHLFDAFVYCSVIQQEESLKTYIHALSWFKGNIDKSIQYLLDFSHTDEWTQALGLLKGSMPKSDDDIAFDDATQQKHRAQAVANLRKKFGVEYDFDEHFCLRLTKEDEVAAFVANLMNEYGGTRFLACLLPHFDYETETGRLFINRLSKSGLPESQMPEMPLNYLLNLAIANLNPKQVNRRTKEESQKLFKDIQCWALTYCLAYYEAQAYTIWDILSHRDRTFVENWMRLAYKDGLNYFRQTSLGFIMDYCNFIIDNAKNSLLLNQMPYSLDNLWDVYHALSQLSDPHRTAMFHKESLEHIANSESVFAEISQPIANVNAGFECAADYDKVTYWTHPVIKVDDDHYLLLPSTIGASCWYDNLTNILRKNVAKGFDFQSWLGNVQETYVVSIFNSRGIEVKTGKYKVQWDESVKTEEGEADFIIEGTGFKLLIESKTKSFTRKALSGYDVNILLDIVQGLFNSQTQAIRTATALHVKKQLILCDDHWTPISNVDYKDEKIEKITLTYGDYGFFQDRMLVNRILSDIINHGFSLDIDAVPEYIIPVSNRESVKKSFKKIVDEQQYMSRYLTELAKIDTELAKNPFFDSWHLNLEQLVYLLSLSNDADSLYQELTKCKYASTTTLDFWNERKNMEKIRMNEKIEK